MESIRRAMRWLRALLGIGELPRGRPFGDGYAATRVEPEPVVEIRNRQPDIPGRKHPMYSFAPDDIPVAELNARERRRQLGAGRPSFFPGYRSPRS
jgi:hypothetical protein